MDRVYQ